LLRITDSTPAKLTGILRAFLQDFQISPSGYENSSQNRSRSCANVSSKREPQNEEDKPFRSRNINVQLIHFVVQDYGTMRDICAANPAPQGIGGGGRWNELNICTFSIFANCLAFVSKIGTEDITLLKQYTKHKTACRNTKKNTRLNLMRNCD
jgi:hypothetical protein